MKPNMKRNNVNAKRSLYDLLQSLQFGNESTQIQIIDNREVLIECCKGIVSYDENAIKLLVGDRILTFTGYKLMLQSFNVSGLIMKGELYSIEFSARGDHLVG